MKGFRNRVSGSGSRRRAALVAASGFFAMVTAGSAVAETWRANELTPEVWRRLRQGEVAGMTIEFREGDRLPLSVKVAGHFAENLEPTPVWVTVKRHFFLRFDGPDVEVSLDGKNFRPHRDVLTGNLSVGFSTGGDGGVAEGAELGLEAWLKEDSIGS